MDSNSQHLLAMLHLASPALPIGGYAYSAGLEQAIEDRIVSDPASAHRWIADVLELVLARQDFIFWVAAYQAFDGGDLASLARINHRINALRETAELRLECAQMGQSCARLFPNWLSEKTAEELHQRIPHWSYPAAYAVLCAAGQLSAEQGLMAYGWSWLENQVLVAVKHIPLGQSDGQSLLHALKPKLIAAVSLALRQSPEDAGSGAIGLAIVSSRHETQYSRLFRS